MSKGKMVLTHESPPLSCQYDYEDRSIITIDFGPGTEPHVDIVEGTAIIVANDHQHEFDLPDTAVEAFNRNGIVTFELEQ